MIQLNLDKNKKYLLACSFGPDSMALFYLLQSQGYKFDCAIVNYHLRKESDSEVEGLVKYASKFDIKVRVLDVKDVPTKNIEATCRKIRYSYFHELTDKYHYDAILVAHHQDDLIETYLMQKERQNYPIFYGINENTTINGVKIVRPLLEYSKQELLDICVSNHVPYSVDKTNFDLSIKRNKIRHQIVSNLSSQERANILKEIKSKNKDLLDIRNKLDSIDLNSVKTILSLSEIERRYAFNELLNKSGIVTSFSKDNVGQAISVFKSNKPNGEYKIKNGLILVKEYDYFEFAKQPSKPVEYTYKLETPSQLETDFFYLDFVNGSSNRNVSLDDYPLTIRNIHKDDVVQINGYKVEARRLLIDWKVPYRTRLKWPVIINKDNKCVYIPRYQKDFKPKEDTNFYVKLN